VTAPLVQVIERDRPGEAPAEGAHALAAVGVGPVRARADDPAAPVVYHATALDRYLPLHLAAETTGPVVIVAHGLVARPDADGPLARLEPCWARDLAVSAAALAALAPRVRAVVVPGDPVELGPAVPGLPRPVAVGPLVDPGAWRRAEPTPSTVRHVDDTMRTTVVVCEAPLTPLVPVLALLEAFHAFATWRDRRARLVVTGPIPMARYARVVQRFLEELALGAAWLAGVLDPGDLRPILERADGAVVLPGPGAGGARARAAAAGVPVLEFDGRDPLALADRLAAPPARGAPQLAAADAAPAAARVIRDALS
jgi:hypothetical protein